jgi:hypothetical protein
MYDSGAAHGFVIRDGAEGDDAEHGFSTRESDAPPQLVLRFVPLIELPPPPTTTTTTTLPPTTAPPPPAAPVP